MSDSTKRGFSRLELEWRNMDAPDFMLKGRLVSMSRLRERVLEIQASETYVQTWKSLVLGDFERHAHNEEYVARLLVLLDNRVVPINPLQLSVGFQLGHLFRTLNERAGVKFRAHTSTMRARIREDYYPWPCQVFVLPDEGVVLHGEQEIPIPDELEVFKKDEWRAQKKDVTEDVEEEYGEEALDTFEVDDQVIGLLPDVDVVPVPIHPRIRNPPAPPVYRATPFAGGRRGR